MHFNHTVDSTKGTHKHERVLPSVMLPTGDNKMRRYELIFSKFKIQLFEKLS